MKTIHKYELEVTGEQWIEIPHSGGILSVGTQNDKIYVWALVDPANQPVPIKFRIFGTGQPFIGMPTKDSFLGTVMTHSRSLVWHIFSGGI